MFYLNCYLAGVMWHFGWPIIPIDSLSVSVSVLCRVGREFSLKIDNILTRSFRMQSFLVRNRNVYPSSIQLKVQNCTRNWLSTKVVMLYCHVINSQKSTYVLLDSLSFTFDDENGCVLGNLAKWYEIKLIFCIYFCWLDVKLYVFGFELKLW